MKKGDSFDLQVGVEIKKVLGASRVEEEKKFSSLSSI